MTQIPNSAPERPRLPTIQKSLQQNKIFFPFFQIDGLYTVQVSPGTQCLSTVMADMNTGPKSIEYEMPSTGVSLQVIAIQD